MSDRLWELLEPFYREGNWEYPKTRGVAQKKLLKSEKEVKKVTTPLREKNTTASKSTRKAATPQRYNRQLAALSGGTPKRGTPSRKKILSSTFAQKDDDTADFVSISKLIFNKSLSFFPVLIIDKKII